MLFSLEALQAFHGDCLLLHSGPADQPSVVLIDGGITGTWATSLRPRLDQIRAQLTPANDFELELVVVSHIDGDHIQGLIRLATNLLNDPTHTPFAVGGLWHNSFDDVLGNRADELRAAAATTGNLAGAGRDTEAVIASVPEGRILRDLAKKLGWDVNQPMDAPVTVDATSAAAGGPLELDSGAKVTVVGPGRKQLERLYAKWEAWLKHAKPEQLVVAALTDPSVFNRSSLVLLVEADGQRMLLTGDSRGDDICSGLKDVGAAPNGVTELELLKVPHHGSANNVDEDFFRRVLARHYVISADGNYLNPDTETLNMLVAARKDDDFAIHLTNHGGEDRQRGKVVGRLEDRLDGWVDAQRRKGRKFEVHFRKPADLGVRVDLSDPLPY